jgi:AraC family transcriptional regulator, positive regulator of tynA and feaB
MGENWTWRPELGRWRLLEHGFPSEPVRVAISTSGVPQRQAYEHWRDLAFSDFEPGRIPRETERAFRARASGLCWERADFFLTQSGALSGSRTRRHISTDGLDSLSIGLVIDGQRQARQDCGAEMVTRAGGLFVYDAMQPGSLDWTSHKGIYLVIRRPDAEAVLGHDIPGTDFLMRRMERSPVRHVLADQLRTLSRHMAFLPANEQAYVLDQTIQLALFALSNPGEEAAAPDSILLHVALRHIETNIADPNLGTQRLAKLVACSRATLYRAFGAEGLGVAETIRDMRLDRARMLLEQSSPNVLIADIAAQCGLYDTANFSRQFRRRFGLTPSDVRRASR